MKFIAKFLTFVGTVLLVLGTLVFSLYVASSFHTVVEGKFNWDMKLAPGVALAALLMILLIANAATNIKLQHPRTFGVTQVFIGCLLLITQFSQPPNPTPDHEGFAVKLLVGLFSLVQGIENIKHRPVRP
jgi:hypothetical protein